jgi:hypothetical protein
MQRVGSKKNSLDQIELETAREYEKKHRRKRRIHRQRQREVGERTRIGKGVGGRKRKVPPVPKDKTLAEIKEMPPESEEFRLPDGRPRRWENPDGTVKTEPQTWMDYVRAADQKNRNARRARARKYEAEVVVAQKILAKKNRSRDPRLPESQVDDEERLIAEKILDLDDWDNEELIRGYRRNRSGRFGQPPTYVPREIQQEAFRRLIGRGERKMKTAYIEAVEALVDLAHNADSEKVKLDAIKTLMERVVGKVPDIVRVSQEAPWEAMLADAIVPLSETIPFELTPNDEGVYALEAVPESEPESEGEVETPTDDAARRDPTTGKAPSPSRRSKSNGKPKSGGGKR